MGQLVGNYNAHMRVRGCSPVLLDGSFGSAPGHKLMVVLNDLGGVGRRVATGGVQVVVTGELGSDVYRQSIADRISEKDASEVVRTEW